MRYYENLCKFTQFFPKTGMFDSLNLPSFDIKLERRPDGEVYVFDNLRRKWLVLTPEEWVRQHFVNYLINRLGYPASFMANEVGLKLNGTRRRCDTVIYSRDLRPVCIVEYKRTTVEITRHVFDQIARYNSVLGAVFLIVSNGLKHYCCRFEGDGYVFMPQLPTAEQLMGC